LLGDSASVQAITWHSGGQEADYRARGLVSGTVGALSELGAASDLLNRGYEVLRSVSPACSCDLVVSKDGKLSKNKMRTGRQAVNTGKIQYPTNRFRADHFAAVFPDRVFYEPNLD